MGKRLIIKGADFSENGVISMVDLDLVRGAYGGNDESSWQSSLVQYATSRRVNLGNGLYVKTRADYCIVGLCLYSGETGDMSGRFYANEDTVTNPEYDQYNRTQEWSIFSQNIGNYPFIKIMVQREDGSITAPITLDENEIFESVEYI